MRFLTLNSLLSAAAHLFFCSSCLPRWHSGHDLGSRDGKFGRAVACPITGCLFAAPRNARGVLVIDPAAGETSLLAAGEPLGACGAVTNRYGGAAVVRLPRNRIRSRTTSRRQRRQRQHQHQNQNQNQHQHQHQHQHQLGTSDNRSRSKTTTTTTTMKPQGPRNDRRGGLEGHQDHTAETNNNEIDDGEIDDKDVGEDDGWAGRTSACTADLRRWWCSCP